MVMVIVVGVGILTDGVGDSECDGSTGDGVVIVTIIVMLTVWEIVVCEWIEETSSRSN